MPDKILIPRIPLKASVGCTERERKCPQPILVDIELSCDVSRAARTDSIADAIDYVAVRREAARVAARRPYALIEAIAERVAAALLERFPASAARIQVRKPSALAEHGVPWAGVEVYRMGTTSNG